jgi:hypothetical protein
MFAPFFNVTLIRPPGYVHGLALKEAADYVDATLRACGYRSSRTDNYFIPAAFNIVFCAHLLDRDTAAAIPVNSIIFNSEQLDDAEGWHFRSGVYRSVINRFIVWDYSPHNLDRVPHDRKSLIPFMFCEELKRHDIPRSRGRSLLFYGSLTDRRRAILKQLQDNAIPIEVIFGEYEATRDAKMLTSWAVLNLHKTDHTKAFEPIRCFYPLINDVPVISEEVADNTADHYRGSMFFFELASLIRDVKALYNDPQSFANRSQQMLATFKGSSAISEMKTAVERLFCDISSTRY